MARHLKQLAYGLVYLAIFGGLGYWVYLRNQPAPTCFDNVQNQGELGIDCGPVCSNICLSSLKPIETAGPVFVFRPDTSRVEFLGSLANRNTEMAASRAAFTFIAYDSAGAAYAFPGESYLYADEIHTIGLLLDTATTASFSRAELVVSSDTQWVAPNQFSKPLLTVQSSQTVVGSSTITVSGRLTNQDTVPLSPVRILAVFYSGFGVPIGISQTQLDSLQAGENREFVVTHPNITGVDPTKTIIYPQAARI